MVKLDPELYPTHLLRTAIAKLKGIENPARWLIPAFPVVGLLLLLIFFVKGASPLSTAQPLSNEPAGEIRGAYTVGQTFYSPYPGLNRIDVVLATYARQNHGEVFFNLTTGPRSISKLVSIGLDAAKVPDNKPFSFEFPAIGDSAGKTYYFYFQAPDATPGNAITAWSDSRNPYSDGAAFFEGKPTENDLAFKAYYSPSPWQLADVYLDRLARGKPGLWGSKMFYAVAFGAYLALAGALFFVLYRWSVKGKGEESW